MAPEPAIRLWHPDQRIRAKYCQTLGNKPNSSIRIIFDRLTFKISDKIARLLGKIINTVSLRFISLSFPKKIVLWEDMSFLVMDSLYNENGKWQVPINVWSGGKTFTPCAARKIIFQKENLNMIISSNAYGLFYSVYLVFSFLFFSFFSNFVSYCQFVCRALSVAYVTRINAGSWHIARQTILLALFTFARIACLLKLWIKTSELVSSSLTFVC